ncbi:MAG: hypothetical protein ABIT37_03580 [Luteolibacter sp.]
MFELLQASFSQHQILLTIILGMVVCYWLMVILGVLDMETDVADGFGDGDMDMDMDSGHDAGAGGIWMSTGRFVGFSKVPLVVWLSFMSLFMWFISLVLNEYWNPDAAASRALILLLPNFVASGIVTKIVTIPIARLFAAMADADHEGEEVLGRTGIVTSMEADETYGQIEIAGAGAPLLINVRCRPGDPAFKKGAAVRVTAAGPDEKFYYIESPES